MNPPGRPDNEYGRAQHEDGAVNAGLQAWQNALAQQVLHATGPAAALLRPGGIGPARRLAIYHTAYRLRLRDALRDLYGHTLRYLGDEAFDAAALVYVETHPSDHANLRHYGGDFHRWLPTQLRDEPEVGEVALLDHTLRGAFDGPDAMPLSLADLATIDPEAWGQVGFVLHPTCTRLQLRFNALALWQAVDDGFDAPPPLPLAEPGEVLVWRRGQQPHFRSIGAVEAMALTHLQAGTGFAATCAALAGAFPERDTASEAGALLRRWLDDELLCGITRGTAST
jgi:hypothetical protein